MVEWWWRSEWKHRWFSEQPTNLCHEVVQIYIRFSLPQKQSLFHVLIYDCISFNFAGNDAETCSHTVTFIVCLHRKENLRVLPTYNRFKFKVLYSTNGSVVA